MTLNSALTDVKTLRSQARKHIEQGAVTAGYSADRTEVLKLLNEALATEIVCMCAIGGITLWPAAFMPKASLTNFSCTPT